MQDGRLEYGEPRPRRTVMKKLPLLIGGLMAGACIFSDGTALADDLDCFDGSCRGSTGIPMCPTASEEIFWITYANNDANVNQDCTTVVSCTNFNKRKDVAVDCRFFHGFNGIVAGGGPQDALCNTGFLTLGPGDSGQCATEVDDTRQEGESELSGEIFTTTGGAAECPPFEGKGLLCATGDNLEKVVCEAYLSCRGGEILEDINIIPLPLRVSVR
jgi:hypothetical protein